MPNKAKFSIPGTTPDSNYFTDYKPSADCSFNRTLLSNILPHIVSLGIEPGYIVFPSQK